MIPQQLLAEQDPSVLLPKFSEELEEIRQLRHDLDDDLMQAELALNAFVGSMDALTRRLEKKVKESRTVVPPAPAAPFIPPPVAQVSAVAPAGVTLDEFKTHMDALLKGSLDAVTDKLSDKLAGMLKEMKTLSGPAREMKFQEFRAAADFEAVDLSQLYVHEKVQSNLEEIGVEEKETKSIDSTLERLRKLRGSKPK
ncbi:MAG: hypothetical protein HQL18_02955 [Candidatus Omnitrophica bacterium]|nr:hypothetical protein [Candidatus Omnitrophota bacterium]